MSSPNLPSSARSFIFTTTGGKRCTAILKAVQFSNVPTATGRDSRLPATTTRSTTTTTTEATTRDENTVPVNTSASPPPPLEDSIIPSSTSSTSILTTIPTPPVTSTSSSLLPTSSPEAEQYSVSNETETSAETSIVTETASEIFPDDAVVTPFASTGANLQPSSTSNAVQATENPTLFPTISSVPSAHNSEAAKVAGGVLSGLVVLSLIGLFLWLWRRRRLQKRRSTLLTPLGTGPGTDPNEKTPYIISRRSIGPTPGFVKAKAALGYKVERIRERISQAFSEPSILLSPLKRGPRFEELNTHSRNPSLAFTDKANGTGSAKGSTSNWWSRMASHMRISKWLRNMRNDEVVRDRHFDAENTSERKARLKYQPDFLTLIAMDDGDLGREAQGQGQQRLSVTRQDSGGGSRDKVSTARPLRLDEGDSPFRDNNLLSHISAIPAPLAAGLGRSDNPASDPPYPVRNLYNDATTISKPPTATNYGIEDRRRRQSRGHPISISASTTANGNPSRQPSTRTYRESIDSFTTHRNKFRSDPFDLERPELLGGVPQVMASQGTPSAVTGPRHPPSAHTRQESLGGSMRYSYSSGVVSLDEWSDPGPDVGYKSAGSGDTRGYGRVRSASVSVGRDGGQNILGRAI
ncbi:hypothetical protein GE21DRAFT_10289 [Neurospora crassa]|nr:hypothetical protein GE21DRAFT_10289 [Neurospora crassa]